MPLVRLTCPACDADLELDEADTGGPAQCGRCGAMFDTPARPPAPPPARLVRRGRPRWDDYHDDRDDDWDPPPRRRRRRRGPAGDGAATASLVLGIVSLFLFCPWPLGMVVAGAGLALGTAGLPSRSRRAAVAGLVLSAVGLIFAAGFAVLTVAAVAKSGADKPAPPNRHNQVFQP